MIKKKTVAMITPREQLTKKAYKAIEVWAVRRCKGLHIYTLLIKYTLEAERMSRVKLYSRLEGYGYKWVSNPGYWKEPMTKKAEAKESPS